MGTRAVAHWLVAAALLLAACAPAEPARAGEPTAAAAFVSAHVEADASRVAASVSPLYWAELRRRGRAGATLNPLWAESARLLDFSYVGGIVDDGGFNHLLYAARPKAHPDGPTSVWRLDLDPRGLVIWGEPTRLLPSGAQTATPGPQTDAARRLVGAAPGHEQQRAGSVVGVRSSNGDGYYALGLYRPGSARPTTVVCFGVDQDGDRVPDYWSFGQQVATGAGGSRLAQPFRLESTDLLAEDRVILGQYLRTIQ